MSHDDINDDIVKKSPDDDRSMNELDTIPMDFIDKRLEDVAYVRNLLEAILLVASEPIDLERIAKSLSIKKAVINEAVNSLMVDYSNRGVIIRKVAGGLELGTSPDVAECIERFFQMERRRRVSRAALQTLSIIAYNQPVTRAEIESFRGGVNSDGVLQSLLERGLIKIAAKKDTPGNPYLYSVSDEFLRYFGLSDIDELKRRLPAISQEITEDGGVTQLRLQDLGMKTGREATSSVSSEGKTDNQDEIVSSPQNEESPEKALPE